MQKRGSVLSCKKGQIITRQMLIHLGMFAILAFIAVILFGYVRSIEKDTEFQKIFLSKDLAMLTNTIYSLPGDTKYSYSFDKVDLGQFNFELKAISADNDVSVVSVESEKLAKTYPYARTFESMDYTSVSGAKSLKFSKQNSKLTINKNE